MFSLFCGTNQKKVLQSEIKDLTFEVSNLSITLFFKIISYERPNIHDIHTERRWGGVEFCSVFMDSIVFKQQIYWSIVRLWKWEGWGWGPKN